jgi:hypothetical protein
MHAFGAQLTGKPGRANDVAEHRGDLAMLTLALT